MKLITAIIQPDKLDEVREALHAAEITRITVSRCTGRGHQAGEELYRGQSVIPTLIPKVRIDIACNEEYVDIAINAILKSAQSFRAKSRSRSMRIASPVGEKMPTPDATNSSAHGCNAQSMDCGTTKSTPSFLSSGSGLGCASRENTGPTSVGGKCP